MGNTILIAEDHKFSLKLITRYFTQIGFTVYPAETCAEAIKLAGQHRPDCFLLDYAFPDGTAREICGYVRSHEGLSKTPIVILSGYAEKAIESYEICQADTFVEKGKSYAEVSTIVKSALRRVRWERGALKRSDLTLDSKRLSILKGDKPVVFLSPEQFRLFAALFEQQAGFVDETELCRRVFNAHIPTVPQKAINALIYRLRQKLGPRLARRIKSKKRLGWIYVEPRIRN